jgi:hypothetical protein
MPKSMFQKLDLFPSSGGEGSEETTAVLDPLEGTNCNYWADHVCIMKIIYINT